MQNKCHFLKINQLLVSYNSSVIGISVSKHFNKMFYCLKTSDLKGGSATGVSKLAVSITYPGM